MEIQILAKRALNSNPRLTWQIIGIASIHRILDKNIIMASVYIVWTKMILIDGLNCVTSFQNICYSSGHPHSVRHILDLQKLHIGYSHNWSIFLKTLLRYWRKVFEDDINPRINEILENDDMKSDILTRHFNRQESLKFVFELRIISMIF